MRIFRAIGLGLAIIIIRFLMPEVFQAFEEVLLKFFGVLDIVLSKGGDSFSAGIFVPPTVDLIPQMPY